MQAVEQGPFATIEDVVLDADGQPMGTGRPEGLHQSTLIKRWRASDPRKKGAPDGWQEYTAMYFGFLWEWALELAFKAIGLNFPGITRQWRVQRDGIHGTVDGVDLTGEEPLIHEYKLTFRSMANLDGIGEGRKRQPAGLADCMAANFDEWLMQVMGYAAMLQAQGIPAFTVRFFILFVNGDYKGTGPRVRVVDMRFSQGEIDANWALLRRIAEEEFGHKVPLTEEEVFRGFVD